jgi:hypothetical protein
MRKIGLNNIPARERKLFVDLLRLKIARDKALGLAGAITYLYSLNGITYEIDLQAIGA